MKLISDFEGLVTNTVGAGKEGKMTLVPVQVHSRVDGFSTRSEHRSSFDRGLVGGNL